MRTALKLPGIGFSAALLTALALAGCALQPAQAPLVQGVVALGGPLAHARVELVDAKGVRRSTHADAQGRFAFAASGLQAPLLLSAIEAGSKQNCRYNASLRARCMASAVLALGESGAIANINPLTDRIVSDVAVSLKYPGPQQLVEDGQAAQISAEALAKAKKASMAGFSAALQAAGVADLEHFDAISTPMQANRQGVDAVLEVIHHNRNYHNPTSESSHTVLTDISFRPIVSLLGSGEYEPLDFKRARAELQAIRQARVRVLVVGDSTAATYELERMPRMGWGQVLEAQFRADAGVKVLNAARAGRSSKDFYMGGWYQQMARFMQPGDLVLINHGHNDQNCDASKKGRGAADVAGLCSYPNDPAGLPQFPPGKPEMSFQKSLERYVSLARAAGATPVLLTPTTRVWNKDRKPGFPVVHQHLTRQNAAGGFAYVGDYSLTVKQTAAANGVPLIDLEASTISFANAHAHDWKDYWLAVADSARWPYYAKQNSGTFAKPDTTHFQQKGAEAVAGFVAQGLRESPTLKVYASLLK